MGSVGAWPMIMAAPNAEADVCPTALHAPTTPKRHATEDVDRCSQSPQRAKGAEIDLAGGADQHTIQPTTNLGSVAR